MAGFAVHESIRLEINGRLDYVETMHEKLIILGFVATCFSFITAAFNLLAKFPEIVALAKKYSSPIRKFFKKFLSVTRHFFKNLTNLDQLGFFEKKLLLLASNFSKNDWVLINTLKKPSRCEFSQ